MKEGARGSAEKSSASLILSNTLVENSMGFHPLDLLSSVPYSCLGRISAKALRAGMLVRPSWQDWCPWEMPLP